MSDVPLEVVTVTEYDTVVVTEEGEDTIVTVYTPGPQGVPGEGSDVDLSGYATLAVLNAGLATKQSVEPGKGLSTNDYTTAEKMKLGSIAVGATQNASDAALRDRSTHTGTQPISTVSGLQIALDGKVSLTGNETISGIKTFSSSINSTAGAQVLTKSGAIFIQSGATAGATAVGETSIPTTSTGTHNTAVGANTLSANTNGSFNVAVGANTLSANTSGQYNVAIGRNSLVNNVAGESNMAIGLAALVTNINGSFNTAIGVNALSAGTGPVNNVAIGNQAGQTNNGTGSVFIGFQAGQNVSGNGKLVIANSNTATPLVDGDFGAGTLKINGALTATAVSNFAGISVVDGSDIVLGTSTGTKFGTGASQKIAFYGQVPVTQQVSSQDLGVVLATLGLRVSGADYPISTSGTIATSGSLQATGSVRMGVGPTRTNNVTLSINSMRSQAFDATANPIAVTLPTSAVSGYEFVMKKIDVSMNPVTLGGTFDGQTDLAIGHKDQVVIIQSTTTSGVWRVIYNSHPLYTHYLFNQVTNTAAELSAIGTAKGFGSTTLPAGFWYAGRRVKLILKGSYQTPGLPNGVVVKIKVGTTILAQVSVAATLFAANSTANALYGEAVITCSSTSSGVARLSCEGFLTFQMSGGTTAVPFSTAMSQVNGTITPTTGTSGPLSTVDYTIANAGLADVTEQWGGAQAGQGTTITSGRLSESF